MALSIPDRDDWFEPEYGFPRPNWGAVHGWFRVFAAKDDLDTAWQQFTRHWLNRLRAALGGDYAWEESEHFLVLSEQAGPARAKLLSFLEQTRGHIRKVLGDLADPGGHGKHLVLRFSETDDYYAYISHFHADGEFAGSGGMFLTDGYLHVAYPQSWSGDEERRTVVHELTHNLLAHLPLPPWLNEGLAMAFETDIAGGAHEPLNRELATRHREYWDTETIQQFWSGESFHHPDGQELAYSLARVLLNLIHSEVRPPESAFRQFVLRADWGDASAIAAREHLRVELEELATSFLGPGDWTPKPKTWKKPPNDPEIEELPED